MYYSCNIYVITYTYIPIAFVGLEANKKHVLTSPRSSSVFSRLRNLEIATPVVPCRYCGAARKYEAPGLHRDFQGRTIWFHWQNGVETFTAQTWLQDTPVRWYFDFSISSEYCDVFFFRICSTFQQCLSDGLIWWRCQKLKWVHPILVWIEREDWDRHDKEVDT